MKLEVKSTESFKPVSIVIESRDELNRILGCLMEDGKGRVPPLLIHELRRLLFSGSDGQSINILP